MPKPRVFFTTIVEHSVARWKIPAWSGEIHASTPTLAREYAARDAHVRVGTPPWRPYLNASLRHINVEEIQKTFLR